MNLIYQYYRDPNQEQNRRSRSVVFVQTCTNYHILSKNSLSAYAKTIGVEYQFLDQDLPGNIPPFYGIFLPFIENHDWYKQFEYICFVDSDFLVTTHAKNVFEYANPNCISAWWMPTMARWRGKAGYEWFAEHGHINSGVVIWPRSMFAELVEFLKTEVMPCVKTPKAFPRSLKGKNRILLNEANIVPSTLPITGLI